MIKKRYKYLIILSLSLLMTSFPAFYFMYNNNVYAQSKKKSGGAKKSATKKSARAGSTTKKKSGGAKKSTTKKSARAGSTTKAGSGGGSRGSTGGSARAGTTTVSRGAPSGGSARSGTTVRVSGGSSPRTAASLLGKTTTYKSSAGDKSENSCMYAYVNCMDSMIPYVLKKNPFLNADAAVTDLMTKDKPFRCIFATGDYSEKNLKISKGKISFKRPDEEESASTSIVGGGLGSLGGFATDANADKQKVIQDWAATGLYKQYNYFCDEKDNTLCEYSFKDSDKFFASQKSTSYYMDIYARIKGGCSNGTMDWDAEGDQAQLSKDCKATDGRWYKPETLKMTDMNSDLMASLGFSEGGSGGKCYSNDSNDACLNKGRTMDNGRCLIKEATEENCVKTFGGNWERTKEFSFAINISPPSMTLNSEEEFKNASNICFTGVDFANAETVKSKRIEQFKQALSAKNVDSEIIDAITAPSEADNKGYIEILAECGQYRENLETFYQTGVWKAADGTENNDSGFTSAPANCAQYQLSLQGVRQKWKGQATEAITEGARALERKMKEDEAKELQSDLKTNLMVANMTNEIFKTCLGDFKTCLKSSCGDGYKNCVTEDGLVKSLLTDAALTCYPSYKICMDTTTKTLDKSNMSPQMQKIIIDLDAQKMSEMAMDTVKAQLSEEYVNKLTKSCTDAGGFVYANMCGIMIFDTKNTSTEALNRYIVSVAARYSGDCSDKGKKNGKCNLVSEAKEEEQQVGTTKSSMSKNSGIAIPGVSFNCDINQKTNTATGGAVASSVTCTSANNDKSVTSGSQSSTASGTQVGGAFSPDKVKSSTATTSCNVTSEINVIYQGGDGDFTIKGACSGISPFIPSGWENVVGNTYGKGEKCFPTRMIVDAGGATTSQTTALQQFMDQLKKAEVVDKETGKTTNPCTPAGYIENEIDIMFKNDWQKIFANTTNTAE